MTHATADTVLALRDAILAALNTQPRLQVFDGNPDEPPNGPVRLDPDRRAGMYAVLYMGIGTPDDYDRTVCGDAGKLAATWQVTAAGGDSNRALRAALKVRAALTDQHLIPAAGVCTEVLDQVNARTDGGPKPERWMVPMIYRADLP